MDSLHIASSQRRRVRGSHRLGHDERLGRRGPATAPGDVHAIVSIRKHVCLREGPARLRVPGARALFTSLARSLSHDRDRDLDRAKEWLRNHARGSERFGLVASPNAERLRPHAIDVRVSVNPIHWFLADGSDVRSSNHLEDAATEFQVQGLELDWACVTWDADLRHRAGEWRHHYFHGNRWKQVKAADRRAYLVNAYRVLLTRARQGMAIFVPPGDEQDVTRSPGSTTRRSNT